MLQTHRGALESRWESLRSKESCDSRDSPLYSNGWRSIRGRDKWNKSYTQANTRAGNVLIHSSKASVHSYSVKFHIRSVFCGGFPADGLSLTANRASLTLDWRNTLKNRFRSEAQTCSCGQSDRSSLKHDSRFRKDTNRYWNTNRNIRRKHSCDQSQHVNRYSWICFCAWY